MVVFVPNLPRKMKEAYWLNIKSIVGGRNIRWKTLLWSLETGSWIPVEEVALK